MCVCLCLQGCQCVSVCLCLCACVSVCLCAMPLFFYSIEVPSSPQEWLKALTDIVWPEIALLVKEQIEQAREQGTVLK